MFRGGTILTMDPEQPDAEAVAVQGDSIVAVGSEAEVMAAASPGAMVVDLGGRVLLPGFNDAHCHRIDARGSETVEAVIQDALAGGWTSISEMLVIAKSLDELRSLDDEGQLRLRVNAYLAPLPIILEGTEVRYLVRRLRTTSDLQSSPPDRRREALRRRDTTRPECC